MLCPTLAGDPNSGVFRSLDGFGFEKHEVESPSRFPCAEDEELDGLM